MRFPRRAACVTRSRSAACEAASSTADRRKRSVSLSARRLRVACELVEKLERRARREGVDVERGEPLEQEALLRCCLCSGLRLEAELALGTRGQQRLLV